MTVTEAIPTEKFSTEWVNYGDASPEEHGGRFVRFKDDHWEIIETHRADTVLPDGSPESQLVSTYWVYPGDVWTNGEPEEGFENAMEEILKSLHERGGLAGDSPPADSPVFFDKADYYVADMVHHLHGNTDIVDYDDYEELIAGYGVDDYGE